MRSARVVTALLLLGLVPLAACGDDDDQADGALTKAEFIEQGDAICRTAADDGEDLDDPDDDTKDLSRFFSEASEVLGDAADDFGALEPPADGREVQRLYVKALRDSIDVLAAAKAAADDGDGEAARAIVSSAEPEADARGPLQAYGFEVCGSA